MLHKCVQLPGLCITKAHWETQCVFHHTHHGAKTISINKVTIYKTGVYQLSVGVLKKAPIQSMLTFIYILEGNRLMNVLTVLVAVALLAKGSAICLFLVWLAAIISFHPHFHT